ncbi:hypothetical protein YC2023_021118 [Brassica napus]
MNYFPDLRDPMESEPKIKQSVDTSDGDSSEFGRRTCQLRYYAYEPCHHLWHTTYPTLLHIKIYKPGAQRRNAPSFPYLNGNKTQPGVDRLLQLLETSRNPQEPANVYHLSYIPL